MRVLLILIIAVVFSSCVRNKSGQVVQNAETPDAKVFEVTEVVQAKSYSYLKVKENYMERWVAVSKQDIEAGDVFYYDEALEMTNFKSKDLDRTFELIYFVNEISKTPLAEKKMDMAAMHQGKVKAGNAEISLEKSNEELTLAQILEDSKKYAKEEFEIRGIVVKVTPQVMGKNWIHIQDGTSHKGNFDLTITTDKLVEIHNEVVLKGKLSLNKDFGYGYSYDVLMEDAVLVDTKTVSVEL